MNDKGFAMTDKEIDRDADECWALWRRKLREEGHDIRKFSEIDIWHHAYRCGMALGAEIEREACAGVAERCDSEHVENMIRLRTALEDAS